MPNLDLIPENSNKLVGLGGIGRIKDDMKIKEAVLTSNIKKDASLDDLITMKDTLKQSFSDLKNK